MDKRTFLKQLSLLGIAMTPALKAFGGLMEEMGKFSPEELAAKEDFWREIRSYYELTDEYINLENGYYCMLPYDVMEKHMSDLREVNRQASFYMRKKHRQDNLDARQMLADMAGCRIDELVITRNTTESLDLVIQGIHWKKGDEAVMAQQDYGAMLNMFRLMNERYGVVNKIISLPSFPQSDEEIVKLYESQITKRTRLLMVSHVVNINGQVLPVKKICEMADKHGVNVLVDGAHAFGQLDFRISELGCAFYGSSLHKWLSAPLGSGLLYIRQDKIRELWPLLAEETKPEDDIMRLNHIGTKPAYVDRGIMHAITFHNMIGSYRKQERLRFLKHYWTDKIKEDDKIKLSTPLDRERGCAIATVLIEGMTPVQLEKKLFTEYMIYTVAVDRPNVRGCRITPNVYTTTDELDILVRALKDIAANV